MVTSGGPTYLAYRDGWLLRIGDAVAERTGAGSGLDVSSVAITVDPVRPREGVAMSVPINGLEPYLQQSSEHQHLDWIGNMELSVILDAATTGGQVSLIQVIASRGDASPVHIHSRDDEAFLLLEGAMTVRVDDVRDQLRPGGIGCLPRHRPHAFRFDSDSRALIISTPAGQEEFFRSAGWDTRRPKPPDWKISPDALKEAAEAYGTTIIGPPHGLSD
jgi:quercetin dioxygenase-like cupin family protein